MSLECLSSLLSQSTKVQISIKIALYRPMMLVVISHVLKCQKMSNNVKIVNYKLDFKN